MNNMWKRLFFLLLSLNIGIILFFLVIFNFPRDGEIPSGVKEREEDFVELHVQSNKGDLNRMINHFIEKEYGGSPIRYELFLRDEVEFYGTVIIFGQDVQIKLTFVPRALENGDLILKPKSISIGDLQLPVSYVLKFIRDQYEIPEWVFIQPKEEVIYFSFENMELKSNMKIKVRQFDLKKDDIRFTLMVPVNENDLH